MSVIFSGCVGGLFVVDEIGDPSRILRSFPQFEKTPSHQNSLEQSTSGTRHILGVDEASYLRSCMLTSWVHGDRMDELIRNRREQSREVDLLCGAYAHLTRSGYWLNHGGAFGVHYLVYTSPPRDGHSMYLCIVTDTEMSQSDVTVLLRLSRSVRKRAMLLVAEADDTFRVEML
ncbi:endonuclease, putative [Bodo saltans]|uniref:tRNA-intron lyase n=1 Tax=Bodo saltans TaxID=75058 RepID=A0A0S4JEH5_BODSA|nr:endonuclease, putative [Bodo saltans]|eukprot:CUG89990.1 endonuclease, putative [Bodo saltans]